MLSRVQCVMHSALWLGAPPFSTMLLNIVLLWVVSCRQNQSFFNGAIEFRNETVAEFTSASEELSIAGGKNTSKSLDLGLPTDVPLIYFVPSNSAYQGYHAPFVKLLASKEELLKAVVLYNISPFPNDEYFAIERAGNGTSINIIAILSKITRPIKVPTLLEGFEHRLIINTRAIRGLIGMLFGPEGEQQRQPQPLMKIDNAAVVRVVMLTDGMIVVTDRLMLPWSERPRKKARCRKQKGADRSGSKKPRGNQKLPS